MVVLPAGIAVALLITGLVASRWLKRSADNGSNPVTSTFAAYRLDHPDRRFVLPVELTEVSGLTDLPENRVACVQDEDGAIFIFHLSEGRIERRIPFGDPGDYEGLTAHSGIFHVLRSDGVLFEVRDDGRTVSEHPLDLPTRDNEGLAFDARRNRLLVAPKSRPGKGKEFRATRVVFAVDPATRIRSAEPVMEIDLNDVAAFADAHGIDVPQKKGKKAKKQKRRTLLRFLPSSLSVNPVTDEVFILSAIDRVLLSFDQDGRVTGYAALSPRLFPQPEGITFTASGDMLIASEAAGREPVLLLFKRQSDAM